MTAALHRSPLTDLFEAPNARNAQVLPVPVFLVAGFLGSGKTTLLREILARPGMADTALIINEFGEVGLDQMLVQSAIENVLLMENGCICCSIRGDMVDTINDLFARAATGVMPPFSRIIIETTGLADPGPIIRDLTGARGLSQRIRLEKVIVTVDGVLGARQLRETEEVAAQVAMADLVLVTKCDLAEQLDVSALIEDIRAVSPAADVMRADGRAIDISRLFERSSIGLSRPSAIDGVSCDGGDVCSHAPGTLCTDHPAGMRRGAALPSHVHQAVQSWSVRVDRPLEWAKVRDWLDLLYSTRPSKMLRMKGILNLDGHRRPVVVHGVGALVSAPIMLDRWPGAEELSEIVVITRHLDSEAIGRTFDAIVLGGKTRDFAASKPPRATLP